MKRFLCLILALCLLLSTLCACGTEDAVTTQNTDLPDNTNIKIGVQSGTTGECYLKGDADWGFDGYAVETKGYKAGSLAVQDMINGNISFVVIDEAPAKCIVREMNG